MKLVQRVETLASDTLRKYADTFSGLGCITDVEYHMQLDPTHRPVVHPPCRVPIKLRSKIKEELKRMEHLKVIELVREPSDWVSSMVTVTKPNGSLHVCIDPRDLNKAIKREMFYSDQAWELKLVSSCSACSTYQRSNTKEPLMPHPAPSLPWEKVGADLRELNGRSWWITILTL